MPSKNGYEAQLEEQIEKEICGLQMPPKPVYSPSYVGRVIIFGLPIIPKGKVEKLTSYLIKDVQSTGLIIDDVFFPLSDKGETKGVAFVKFNSHEMAKDAIVTIHGKMFDKKHVYSIILLEEYQKIIEMNTEYSDPPRMDFKFKNNMFSWMLQDQCHDQLLVNYRGNTIGIYEMSSSSLLELITRESFTEIHSFWSSNGMYLASMHSKGVALWGGLNFDQITKYAHKGVQHLTFSPQETYIITYSEIDNIFRVTVWNILQENDIREFLIPSDNKVATGWPKITWSFDDLYFAILLKDKISVYESKLCLLLNKKSIDIPGLKDFSWANKSHLLSYWVPESSTPARIVLLDIPSKNEIFVKNLFNVSEINMFWSSQDDFLGVIGERYAKKRVTTDGTKYIGLTANIEIFRVQEKEIPVEKIDAKEKRSIIDFQWEPNGSKCAMIATHQNAHFLMIYDVKNDGQVQEVKVHSFSLSVKMNMVRWSPKGQHLVCCAIKGSSLEFVDGYDWSFNFKGEHANLSDIAWDPTGRYLASSSLSPTGELMDCVVKFWSVTGKCLLEKSFPGLRQFIWRPRLPCLLNEQKIKEIKKSMSHKYNQKFAQEDELMSNETKRKQMEQRRKLMAEWSLVKNRCMEKWNNEKASRIKMRKGLDTDKLEAGKEKESIYVLVTRTKM